MLPRIQNELMRDQRQPLASGWLLFTLFTSVLASSAFGQSRYPQNTRGLAAIKMLGARLPDFSKRYGFDPNELKRNFERDRHLVLSKDGELHYSCEDGYIVDEVAGAQSLTSVLGSIVVNLDEVFQLQSQPGVSRVIYLDFDGHITSGTTWNSSYTNGADIVTPAFDTDGDPGTFSNSERELIHAVWTRVSEAYSPFSVNVTTKDPGVEGLKKSSSGDFTYGIRVVIGPNTWYRNAGGVARVGSFNLSTDTPTFAFSDALLNNVKYMADAISHEVGHTLGLSHDGTTSSAYYQGHNGWAPIMGIAYYVPLSQFSKGEYASANNFQDDVNVIQNYGPILVADDYGQTTSTSYKVKNSIFDIGGRISIQGMLMSFVLKS